MLTCKQVHELIHSLPLAEYSPAQLEAVDRHARGCAVCWAELAGVKAVEAEFKTLADPSPPPDMKAAIMNKLTANVSREAGLPPDDSLLRQSRRQRDHLAGIAALVGTGVFTVGYAYQLLTGNLLLGFASIRTGPLGSPVAAWSFEPAALVLAFGLFLFLGGLLAVQSGTDAPGASGLGCR